MAPHRKAGGRSSSLLLLLAAAAAAALALALTPAAAAGARLPATNTDTASAAWGRVQGLLRGEGLSRTQGGDGDSDDDDAGKGKGHKHRAIMSIKYEVPPSLQNEFVDEWRKLYDATADEKGNLVYDLKKTWADNLYFWTYGEWKSYEDYMDHFRSDPTESFLSWLDDHDVMWTLYPLKNITDEGAAKSAKADPASVAKKGKGGDSDDPRDMMAHVVIQYHVQPSHVDEFLDAWQDAAQSTWDEEHNTIYALRKVANMNHHFLAYGTWKDYDAYMDHFTSKHVRKLRQFLAERDIQWFAEPLVKKGDQPEDV